MSYEVTFGPGGAATFHSLPEVGRDALLARAVELSDRPWDEVWSQAGGRAGYRETSFGDGRGLMVFYVDDAAEVIRIYDMLWVG